MDFDKVETAHREFNAKWALLPKLFNIDPAEGIGISVADSDYATAPCVTEALRAAVETGLHGYGFDRAGYARSLCWWVKTRHGWGIEPDWVLSTQGLGFALALTMDIWSEPGDEILYFTPVYHEFRNKAVNANRVPVEMPLTREGDTYQFDWERAEAAITPRSKILLFCSPHNPSGRVWTAEEQRQVAEFAAKHDLLLVSDEIHADLIFAGGAHIPMDMAAPEHRARTVTLYAASKTFNIAGLHVGQMIIPDARLRAEAQARLTALNFDVATLGAVASMAAYSPEGLAWRDEQMAYLEGNRQIFDAGLNAIPGIRSLPLESTFLPWVDFTGTGMTWDEIAERVYGRAKVGMAPGAQFGTGGELHGRFNLAIPRPLIEEIVARMQDAFADLQ